MAGDGKLLHGGDAVALILHVAHGHHNQMPTPALLVGAGDVGALCGHEVVQKCAVVRFHVLVIPGDVDIGSHWVLNPGVLRAARIQQNAPRILRAIGHAVPDVVGVVGAAAGVLGGIGDAVFVARRAGGIVSERVFKGLDRTGLAAVGGSIEKQAAVAAGRRRVGANAVGVCVGAG